MRREVTRRAVAASALALAGVMLVGCAGAGGTGDPLQLAVGDGSLRAVGDDCAGTGPYRHIHAGVEVVLTDASGGTALSRTLQPGSAIEATDIDFEETPRIPTFCVFTLDAGGLTADQTYDVTVDGREHGSFTYLPDADGIPTILIPAAAPGGSR